MKMGFASVIIGLIGLIVITYFYLQAEEIQVDTGEALHMASVYTMSLPLRVALFTVEALGVLLGYLAYRGRHMKPGLLGIGLCTLCLILLYGYSF
ncbi:hypothetical protein [Pontibacter amylolyticus]|uniref:DUF4064 domain-containing protein n=1 Tax=Pontibacter amylolyticus TaxID=1424080 RepID=A0ABQ1W2G0_9BACT|nr:hypothetical protein [Pontibacter amylolyticus]GGG10000.1 hypothetical protein GCM10011323_13230 [Pontibacter amylolyticus]